VRPEGFEQIIRRFERLANRIVLGVLTAAFINGLAILLSVYHMPGLDQWVAVLFAVGFVTATVLGCYLAWSVLRSGRG
jgi:ubiquinone biosynthesis protein